MAKRYVKPAITYAERAEARAAGCARSDTSTCSDGPIQS
jgi:hypothetical protein